LLSPTTTSGTWQRKFVILSHQAYVYYVSGEGVTGLLELDAIALKSMWISYCRTITTLPIGVGFGIRDAK